MIPMIAAGITPKIRIVSRMLTGCEISRLFTPKRQRGRPDRFETDRYAAPSPRYANQDGSSSLLLASKRQ